MIKSKGISLISLIVTIVVIIILAGIVIYNGIGKNVDETSYTMDYNEIFEVSEAVAQRALFNKLNEDKYSLIYTKSGEFEVEIRKESGDEEYVEKREFSSEDGWYLIDKESAKDLNLEQVRREYVVNYKTNEVISLVPIRYENTNYYSASELKEAMGGGSIVIAGNRYDKDKGVNKPFVVTGMIPVKQQGGSWVVTSVDDVDWYDYASKSSAKGNLWANIMLMDEIEVEGMTNSEVRNASLAELKGRTVTKEGSMFVWIPRYSRGVEDAEVKIVYSKGTQDFFKENTTENVLDAFENNGVQLSGIWVSKYDAGFIER